MRPTSRFLPLVAGIGVCSLGCGTAHSGKAPGIRAEDVEFVSVKDQALEEIERTPLQFVIPLQADAAGWQRAVSFFKMYLKNQGSAPFSQSRDLLENRGGEGVKYAYRVTRAYDPEGSSYHVACTPAAPGGTPLQAETNARNLARFIKDGTLELSWLDR